MRNPLSRHSRRVRIALAAVAGLIVAYAIAGFFIAPGIIRRNLIRQMGGTLHRTVAVGRVRVNPFALSVAVDSLRVADRDGAELLGWDEFYINFELISIVRRELNFSEIRLVRPYGRIVMKKDGTMNVSDIIDSLTAPPKTPSKPAPLPVVSVDGLHIEGARVDILDSAIPRPFATTVGPWRIDLASFATRRDNNSQYSFSGRTESGETFAWAGTFAIDPVRSSGAFSLDSVKLAKYDAFYERTVGFDVTAGIAGVKARYTVNLDPQGRVMRLLEGGGHVDGLAVVERGHKDTALVVRRVDVSGVEADAVSHRARVTAFMSSGGVVNVARSRDSVINLMRMMVAPAGESPPPAGRAAPPKPAAPEQPWRWLVARIAADSYTVNILDSTTVRPARFAVTGLSVALDTVAGDTATLTRVHASAIWEKRGTLTGDGTVSIWHRQGEIAYTAKDLSLRPLDAYFAPRVNLLISEGSITSDGSLRFDVADTAKREFGFKGNVRVDRFATVDGTRREPFFGFRAFRVAAIDFPFKGNKLTIKEIELDDPDLEIGIAADGRPVTRLIFPNAKADSADSANRAADSAKADTTSRDTAVIAQAPAPAPAAPTPAAAPAATPAPKGKKADATRAPSMKASIGSIKIVNGTLKVSDRSLEPTVAFTVTKLDALTGRLSTDSLGTGTLDVSAMIDGVAPLRVKGSFNPLSTKEGSDLVVDLQSMELVPMGPYSGRYLGYQIEKGKLKVAMQYRVVGRQLKSENKFTLDGFDFGEKTESPEATHMPVKLAFSVMRDREGQIVFDVPVEGDLDDPSFRLGRVIGRAFLNVLTKLATSPFKLLGGVFGGGSADLSYVEFTAGTSALTPSETKKLDVLAKSLYERPALKLQIAGAVDTAADRAALRTAKLDGQLRTRKWTALKAKDPNTPPPDSITLSAADRGQWLTAAFTAAFPNDSGVLAAKRSKAPLPYSTTVIEERLLATIALSPDDLQLLAGARAKKCLDYLLTVPANKIEPERVLLTGGAIKTDGPRAVFTLQ